MVRSPGRPAHSIGPLDRVQERLAQSTAKDLRRIKFPAFYNIIVPQTDIRRTDAIPALATWPLANQAVWIPFKIESAIATFLGFYITTGAGAGTIDLRLYNSLGEALTDSFGTAVSGVGAPKHLSPTPARLQINEGLYYVGVSVSTNTYNVAMWTGVALGSTAGDAEAVGILRANSNHPLPDSFAGLSAGTASALVPGVAVELTA